MADLYQSQFYKAWANMKTRCDNRKTVDFKRYGQRGILYSANWNTFEGFYKDMFGSYKRGLTLDRVDNSLGYNKENCRWTTKKVQANNRRNNRILHYKGIMKTLAQWSEELGIKRTTITQRIDAYGWSVEKALQAQA